MTRRRDLYVKFFLLHNFIHLLSMAGLIANNPTRGNSLINLSSIGFCSSWVRMLFLLSRWEWKQLISLQTIIEYRLERLLEVACVGSLVDWLDAFFAIVRRVWLWFWRERKPDLALKYLCRWTFDFKLIVRPISFLFFVWIMRNMNFSSWTSRSCCDLAHDSTNCVHDNRMRWSKYCVQFQLI